jgi:carbonic anhydrase
MDTQSALSRLKEGNERFVTGKPERPNQTLEHLQLVSSEQNPFAIVLTCNDSRIIPDLVFDQGIGDLSVVKIGGNVVNDHILGTIEYVLEHLGTPLIVVMGHTNCGAVKMAAMSDQARAHIQKIIDEIKPSVDAAKLHGGDMVNNAVILNTQNSVQKIKTSKPFISMMVQQGQVEVVGAVYDMKTGKVNFLGDE